MDTYTSLTGCTFNQRYYGHSHSLRDRESESLTTLSAHIWKLKEEKKNFNIKLDIVSRANCLKKMSIVLERKILYSIPSTWCHAEQKIRIMQNLQTHTKTVTQQHEGLMKQIYTVNENL